VVALTGAGLSTASGIPDYRDHEGRWKRPQPVDHRDFLASAEVRRRYWARSFLGWPTIGLATPGAGHHALAALEARGHIALTVTQNVDGLHQKAGSRAVLELHGAIAEVICLDCGLRHPRAEVQEWMRAANPQATGATARAAPDGDADTAAGFEQASRHRPARPARGGSSPTWCSSATTCPRQESALYTRRSTRPPACW
jgi:NAD-dependent SIR2 family protein deacetylase